jgi:hypothetical protein
MGTQIEKKEVKLPLIADDNVLYSQDPADSTEILRSDEHLQ